MALICSILRIVLKRLQTTLAVAQRIARFLLATFRRTRSRREMWNVAETLLRRGFIPEITNGTVEDDGREPPSNTINDQDMASSVVESDVLLLSPAEMTSDYEEENLMANSPDSPTVSGKSLISGGENVAEVSEEDGAGNNEVCDTPHVQLTVVMYNYISIVGKDHN